MRFRSLLPAGAARDELAYRINFLERRAREILVAEIVFVQRERVAGA